MANELFLMPFKSERTYRVSVRNISYERMSEYSFAIILGFNLSSLPVTESFEFTNGTYTEIESAVNSLLSQILGKPDSSVFTFPPTKFTNMSSVIYANVMYRFEEGDIKIPSNFLAEILKISGDLTTTGAPSTSVLLISLASTTASKGGFPGWALAIIIPCGIAILLLPLWILLCCLQCRCCAACRRRWRRRQSYQVQYQQEMFKEATSLF
nr:PREDICTED: uncharacterized protein LOC107076293 [Lepisosteus oculatus]